MNKEYIQSGNEFIIGTDKGLKKVERVNNMTEILETENNIEEIENIEKQIKDGKFFSYKHILNFVTNKFLKKLFGITSPIIIIITIITAIIISNISIAIAFIPILFSGVCIVSLLGSIISIFKSEKLNDKIEKNANELLKDELQQQNEKLNQLNKESKILADYDLGIMDKTVKIERSKLIDDLKRKLDLIQDYQLNQRKYLKLKKECKLFKELKNKGYSYNDIEFITELALNDLNEENTMQKTKTLKLEKK